MNNSDNTLGAGIYALSKLKTAQRDKNEVVERHNEVVHKFNDFMFSAQSQVHGLRAALYGHRATEDDLIVALRAENANHPLASREAVDAAVADKRARALVNPEVISKTYPNGVLPEGAVINSREVLVAVELISKSEGK